MGLLADIFSTADTAKRRLSGLLSDPMGTLALGVTRFGEDQGGLLNMTQNAYPMAGNKTVLNSPQQIANFRQQVADKGAEMAMQAATVWHGSPHKFDKFDSSKIGTGEGAQAYGHGLYLAESPDVAKSYADALGYDYKYAGKTPKEGSPTDVAIRYLKLNQWDKEAAKSGFKTDGQGAAIRDAIDRLNLDKVQKPGNTYKVDLPDEHIAKMLDWDKPLSQQHPDVQKALTSTKNKQLRAVVDYANSPYSTPGLEGEVKTMGDAIKLLGMNASPAKGSAMLAKQGIPGIRYLDGGSRGTGAGTSNFVVFPGNEGLLQILERNGQAVK